MRPFQTRSKGPSKTTDELRRAYWAEVRPVPAEPDGVLKSD